MIGLIIIEWVGCMQFAAVQLQNANKLFYFRPEGFEGRPQFCKTLARCVAI